MQIRKHSSSYWQWYPIAICIVRIIVGIVREKHYTLTIFLKISCSLGALHYTVVMKLN